MSFGGMPDVSTLSEQERTMYEMMQKNQVRMVAHVPVARRALCCVLRQPFVCSRVKMKEFVQTYNSISKACFDACVNDFTSRSLKPKEVLACLVWGLWLFAACRRMSVDCARGT